MEELKCYVRSNRHGGELKFLYRGDPRRPVCNFHAGLVDKALLQPIPEPKEVSEKAKRMSIQEVREETNIVMGAVPSGEYSLAAQAREEGRLDEALKLARHAAAVGLVGLIRGLIRMEMRRDDADFRIGEEGELNRLFLEAEQILDQASEDPKAAYEAAFDYYESLELRFRIVVPARVLLSDLRMVEEKTSDLPFSDPDLVKVRAKLEGLIQIPSSGSARELELLEEQIWAADDRANNVRSALQRAAVEQEARRLSQQERRDQRRAHRNKRNGDWRALFSDEWNRLSSNVVPIRRAS